MNEPTKILVRGTGIGDIDLSLVERRAEEIALGDGRTESNEVDVEHAFEELSGPEIPEAPELSPGTEELVAWDDSPLVHGSHAETVPLDDEINLVEELILQGNDEADTDRRIVAQEMFID